MRRSQHNEGSGLCVLLQSMFEHTFWTRNVAHVCGIIEGWIKRWESWRERFLRRRKVSPQLNFSFNSLLFLSLYPYWGLTHEMILTITLHFRVYVFACRFSEYIEVKKYIKRLQTYLVDSKHQNVSVIDSVQSVWKWRCARDFMKRVCVPFRSLNSYTHLTVGIAINPFSPEEERK